MEGMFTQRLQAKVADLQKQSPAARMRAAVYITVAIGVVLFLLWLIVFLPVQLYFARTGGVIGFPEKQVITQIQQDLPPLEPFSFPETSQEPPQAATYGVLPGTNEPDTVPGAVAGATTQTTAPSQAPSLPSSTAPTP